jgi:hypothetical protein
MVRMTRPNGLAPCVLHQKKLDMGMFTVSGGAVVSGRAHGACGLDESLLS